MKLAPAGNRNALSALRPVLVLAVAVLVPLFLYGSAPSWWSQRGVQVENAAPDDYAPVNQGQLKNIATAAVAEMDTNLTGGAGDELHLLVGSWSLPGTAPNDFAPLNLGQLKSVAKPFYDRLIAAGLVDYYPWLSSFNPSDDFAIANIGQVKNLFAFKIPATNRLNDPLQDRLAAGQRVGNLALEANALWFWGNRFDGDISFQRTYPRRMTDVSGVRSVAAGDDHLVILGENGSVLTWGGNRSGQLGDGTNLDRSTPGVVPNLSNVLSVKAGGAHTIALLHDGSVVAWGDNYYGQLGNGDNGASSTPVLVAGLNDVRKIAAGSNRSAALKGDGTVWTWGYDHYLWQTGQTVSNNAPIQVSDLMDVVDIAVGYAHVVAVKADGTVWAWGSNSANQVGNGNPWSTIQETPVQVPNLAHVVKVASHFDHTLALLDDHTVWAWGNNTGGQLGDGTTQARLAPVQVSGLTDVIALATNYLGSMAMKADGTVWAWGDGSSGMVVGDELHVPHQVGLGIFDTNHNGIDDRWELQYFGVLDQAGDADFDGDGISNFQEFLRGTDPTDYFNGTTPVIEIVSGNNQLGDPGTFLSKPLTVRLRSATGALLNNAPVNFTVSSGSGSLAPVPGVAPQPDLLVRTDSMGQATSYVMLSEIPGTSARIGAAPALPIVPGTWFTGPSVNFRVITRFAPPPMPSPTPDPNVSPSPTATPTATPLPPYRYAVLDLGKDLRPVRIANNGWVLLWRYDNEAGLQYYRWKAGVLELLTVEDANSALSATDMNDSGVVVGSAAGANSGEPSVGVVWLPDNPIGRRISGPAKSDGNVYNPQLIKYASCSAINDANQIFGQINEGGSFFGLESFFAFRSGYIVNSCRWGEDLGLPLVLSNAHAITVAGGSGNWTGQMDSISRANLACQCIGSSLIATGELISFIPGLVNLCVSSPIVDGQIASFYPMDLNESGIVVGTSFDGSSMVIRTLPIAPAVAVADIMLNGVSPIAINNHVRPAPAADPQPSPTPSPAPQILGWTGNALALWERQDDGTTWYPFGLEEMIPSMDGWDYLEPADMNDNGMIAGVGWYTDPSIPGAPGESHAFLLVPVELMVDGNRDGVIDAMDGSRISEVNPFRFWINDDDDTGDTGGTDIAHPGAVPNFATTESHPGSTDTGSIDGTRDLIDFFPIYLNAKSLTDLFPPDDRNGFTFNLKQKDGSANFVYTDLTARAPLDYLHKISGPAFDNATTLGNGQGTAGAVTYHITSEGVALDPQWVKKIDGSGYGVLLIEGRARTSEPLVLQVLSPNGHKITEIALPISLSPVDQMFRHKNLMAADNTSGGAPDYATGNDMNHAEPENYPDELCSSKSFIFVHGYNVNPDAARGWNAEMFKRLYQSGSRAKFVGVTWHGADTQLPGADLTVNYHINVGHAFQTAKGTDAGQGLAAYVNAIGGDLVIAAHSLGNLVVSSAVSDWNANIETYFMIDAAISLEAFDTSTSTALPSADMIHVDWISYRRDSQASEWYKLFPSTDQRSRLTWRSRFPNLGGKTYNFYSSGEEVLATHPNSLGDPSLLDILYTQNGLYVGKYAWSLQEKLKGRIHDLQSFPILGSIYGGWGFSQNIGHPPHTPSPGEADSLSFQSLKNEPVFDPGYKLIEYSPTPEYPAGYTSKQLHGPPWIEDLTDPLKGDTVAHDHLNTLLAEMLPATTAPVGANKLLSIGEARNIDMQDRFKVAWPVERGAVPDWRHSDIKQIGYPFIYPAFDAIVNLGKLK